MSPDPTTPNRPPLSPAAEAVLDAWVAAKRTQTRTAGCYGPLAAALRAAADQVVPETSKPSADSDYHLHHWTKSLDQYYQRQQTRTELLSIAAELEGHQ